MKGVLVVPVRGQNLYIGTAWGANSKMTTVRIVALSFRVLNRKNMTEAINFCQSTGCYCCHIHDSSIKIVHVFYMCIFVL